MKSLVIFFVCVLNGICALQLNSIKRFRNHSTSTVQKSALQVQHKRVSYLQASNSADNLLSDDALSEEEDDKLIRRLNKELLADIGVELDQLINPSKVVNLERDLIKLEKKMAETSDASEIRSIEEIIQKKKSVLLVERRAVMRGWLKNLFIFQSVAATVISLGMVYNSVPGFDCPLPIQVLGFWMWWLFIIPSLRARKPSNEEKTALNIAFLISPVVSIALPIVTKDIPLIWWVNFVSVALCYAYAYLYKGDNNEASNSEEGEQSGQVLPPVINQIIKALDYGSGQERGQRR